MGWDFRQGRVVREMVFVGQERLVQVAHSLCALAVTAFWEGAGVTTQVDKTGVTKTARSAFKQQLVALAIVPHAVRARVCKAASAAAGRLCYDVHTT